MLVNVDGEGILEIFVEIVKKKNSLIKTSHDELNKGNKILF